MNILLVRPRPHPASVNLQSFMICEPLELEYASAVLKQKGHNVEILDMILEKKSFAGCVKTRQFDLVGFTSYITHVGIVKKYAATVKRLRPNAVTVVGGVQAEVVPSDFIDPSLDCILHSDALNALCALTDAIEKGQSPHCGEIKGIFNKNGGVYPRPCEFDFPFPDRNATAKYRSRYNYIYHDKCATIKTSFGCPYSCDFCFCTRVTEGKYFVRPLQSVVDELAQIEEKNVFIVDDNFLFETDRLEEFCRLLDEKNIHKSFICFGRADFVAEHPEQLRMLKKHGLTAVFVGIESFKDGELSDFNKRTSVDTNIKAIRVLEQVGIQCYSGLIVGYDWAKSDFDTLIRYLNGFSHPMVNIQPITPMPGTPLYEREKDKITVPREKYELWDMAHLVMKPLKMGKRKFYYHILRAYLLTAASKENRRYIKRQYGSSVYRRVKRGAEKIARQYLKLILF